MKARITLVARGTVDVEIDESQRAKIEEEVPGPMDLDVFENLLGLSIDTSDVFGTSHMEVDDVDFLPEPKKSRSRTE